MVPGTSSLRNHLSHSSRTSSPPWEVRSLTFSFRLPDSLEKNEQLLFQSADVAECLAAPGYNVEKLSVPYVPQVTGEKVLLGGKVLLGQKVLLAEGSCKPSRLFFSVLYTVGKILHRCKQTSRGTSLA